MATRFIVALAFLHWGAGLILGQESLERIVPSKDNTHFVKANSGQKFLVWGVNYDHDRDGRLIEDYWHDEWKTVVADFQEIKALNANVVRIHLQLPKFMDAPDKANQANLKKLAELISLAEKTGLYLDITGLGCYHKQDVPEWYDELSETDRWKVQTRFWQAVAKVGAKSPAIFCYDLMNEPILPGKKKEKDWLAGELGGKFFVQRISLDLKGRTREQVAKAWVETMTQDIRQVDKKHMITVGVIPWAHVFKNAKPLFYNPQVGKSLDFVSVHFYPKKGEVAQALAALKVYDIGKPLIVEEIFPLKSSLPETTEFIEKSSSYCDGWVSFYWGQTAKECEKQGDLKGAILAAWFRQFQKLGKKMTAQK